ncbi:MerR family transcriptional regulator [Vogesella indigofera]|uniref:MerR family transcriptional regulator n=3 Tax=Vogesella TaxID=57739 RepID=A0A495B350_VOGIN|nr:MerR family transcriptional regulator [Vogesella indigofera]
MQVRNSREWLNNIMQIPKAELPAIPAKRYFTIGEVSELTGVKQHVLRYWEQEFSELRNVKRRGNRRYYQHREVLLVRRIRSLLYDDGFTLHGARQRLEGDQPAPATAGEVRKELQAILDWLDLSLGKD